MLTCVHVMFDDNQLSSTPFNITQNQPNTQAFSSLPRDLARNFVTSLSDASRVECAGRESLGTIG